MAESAQIETLRDSYHLRSAVAYTSERFKPQRAGRAQHVYDPGVRRNLEYMQAMLVVASAAAVLAGCGTITARKVELPTPPLQLVESRPLVLVDGCGPTGSYFVEFKVLGDGRTGQLRLPSAPACVRDALSAWVGSFRYAPPAQETPAAIEWMLVTARR